MFKLNKYPYLYKYLLFSSIHSLTYCLISFLFCSTTLYAQTELLTFQENLPCINKKFSIVAHVVLDENGSPAVEEEEIRTSVEEVNVYFEPICVSFEVCEVRTISNYQFNMLNKEEELDRVHIENHVANRINAYYVTEIGEGGAVLGCANLNGIIRPNGGGIVLRTPDLITLAHEIGHYFGLLHTFEGAGAELVNGSNCATAGDQICDTPADPFVEEEDIENYVQDCRFISLKRDANGEYYRPDVGNIMSYYPCACGFTHGQYLKMAELAQAAEMW